MFIKSFSTEKLNTIKWNISELEKITEELETMHRRATIGGLAGGVIGAAGGVASLVGLALAPFTFGTSLIVTGVGVGVATAGGVTGAASNITKMTKSKEFQDKIKGILEYCERELKPLIESLNRFQTTANGLQAAVTTGRAMSGLTQITKLTSLVTLSAQAAKAVGVFGRTVPILSSLTLILDVFTIASDAKEIHQMRMRDQGEKPESEMLKFIDEMKQAAATLKEALNELERMKDVIIRNMKF
ncbi:hypothetical protein ACEWY4_024912 [Coilia grayii]|uniref:Apolipoprotein L3 n=1 Tax=Coilia grayii TaxID=363190 RepID=A0ABD1IW26_9TELE